MKKVLWRSVSIFAVILLIIVGMKVLDYLLVDDSASYTRIMMHEFYNQDDIEILCLGASHCYRGIDPETVSKLTGKKVFNASSSSQTVDVSYAIIKEAVKRYNVKEVYLEISESMAEDTGKYKERDDLTAMYLISDYMQPSFDKYELLLKKSPSTFYMNSFFKAKRMYDKSFSLQSIADCCRKKLSNEYREYSYVPVRFDKEWYVGNGFVANIHAVSEHGFYTNQRNKKVNLDNISDDYIETIKQIIEYCGKNEVALVLYDSPVSCFQLSVQGNYDEYINFIGELIAGTSVHFAEFNLLKEDYFDYKQTNYIDGHHFNMYGAEEFSRVLANYINGAISTEAYYTSVKEKLSYMQPEYYGISYNDDWDSDVRTLKLISNIPEYFEYKVELVNEDGRRELLQDYSINNVLEVSIDALTQNPETGYKPQILVSFRHGNVEKIVNYQYEN